MDDFDRDVYCIGGLPFDAIDMSKTISRLRDAKHAKKSCFLTTPNLNFLGLSQHDPDFRNSVLYSDIVIADGAPIVWIAKLLGIPIRERVAGSSLFESLSKEWRRKLAVYFFGGPTGVAAEASKHINEKSTGLVCVGYYSPGFGTLDEMSDSSIIDNINASNADFLKRAPVRLQKIGLEWAWRIKEEPHLWKRYWADGKFLLRFLTTKVLPLMLWLKFNQKRLKRLSPQSSVVLDTTGVHVKLVISGVLFDPVSQDTRTLLRASCIQNKNVMVDLTEAEYLSFGILGLLLLLKKQLDQQGFQMKIIGLGRSMSKLLDRNGLTFLTR